MFLLVPAHPGSPRQSQRAIKRLLLWLFLIVLSRVKGTASARFALLMSKSDRLVHPTAESSTSRISGNYVIKTAGISSSSVRDIVRRRRLGLFGHVARFDHDVPAASAFAVCSDTARRGDDLGGVHDTRGYVKSAGTLTCRPLML